MFKKVIVLFVSLLLVSTSASALSARNAILIERSSGRVLLEKNAYEKRPMASTTKIITAITALEYGNLEDIVIVSAKADNTEGSSMWLATGEKATLENLLFGLMLNSGNDAAVAIAEHIGGSVEGFAELMNQTAEKIGAKNSNFTNPHGLDDPNHYTTAYDLALITRYAMQNPKFVEIVATRKKTVPWEGNSWGRTLTNHNKLLNLYSGADGVKTGYTKNTGRCLVSSATRDGMQLIAVTLNAPDDWNDHSTMLDFGFANFGIKTVLKSGEYMKTVPVTNSDTTQLSMVVASDLSIVIKTNELKDVVITYDYPQTVFAPIAKGQVLGEALVTINGTVIGRVNLVGNYDISVSKKRNFASSFNSIAHTLLSVFRGD